MKDFLTRVTGHFLPSEHNAYRPHLLRKQWLLFFLTIVLTAEGLYVAGILAEQSAQNFLSAVLPGEVIALTNVERSHVGDSTLTENATLAQAAQNKANDMAAKGYFSHVGPDGKEPWGWISEAGYTYRYAGENLAVRFDESSDVVNAWMASPTHRANIVKEQYTEIGIGVAEGMYEGAPATFVVQYFGTPISKSISSAGGGDSAASLPRPAAEEAPPPAVTPSASVIAGASTDNTPSSATATAPRISTPAPEAQSNVQEQASTRVEAQSFLRASDASQSSVGWILGAVATLIMLLLALTVFVHIEIQPAQMLAGGALVGVTALALLMLNSMADFSGAAQKQTASVSGALTPQHTILVGESAAATEVGG